MQTTKFQSLPQPPVHKSLGCANLTTRNTRKLARTQVWTSLCGSIYKNGPEKVWPWEQMGRNNGKKRRKKIGLGGMVKRRLKKETWNNLKSEISHSFSNVEQSQMSCFLLFLRRDIWTCWRNFETAYSSSAEDQNLHVKQRCWPMGRLSWSIAWCPFSWDWHTQKKLWTGGWDKLWNFAVCTRLAECVIISRCSVKMSG